MIGHDHQHHRTNGRWTHHEHLLFLEGKEAPT